MISIVIPNYNGAVLLKRNLPRLAELLKKSKLEFELIVVDDCSTDDSVLFLRQVKGIRLVEKSKKWNKYDNYSYLHYDRFSLPNSCVYF